MASMSERADDFIAAVGLYARQQLQMEEEPDAKAYEHLIALGKQLGDAYVDLRKGIRHLVNVMNSEVDLFREGDQQARRSLGNVSRACALFREQVNVLVHNSPGEDAPTGEDSYDAHARDILQKNLSFENKLRAGILAKNVFMGIAPVLPLAAFDRAKLTRIGVPHDNFRGYAVINNQRVLGITYQYIFNLIEKQKEGDNPELVKQLKRLRTFESKDGALSKVVEEAFDNALAVFHAKFPGFEQVGNPCSWNNARWYWVMPKRELSLLRSAAFGVKSFRLDKWDFAFPSRTKTLKAI